MFTKRYYVKVAHTLNANHASLAIVLDFADMFEEDDERFDRAAFVQAATGNLRDDLTRELYMLSHARAVG